MHPFFFPFKFTIVLPSFPILFYFCLVIGNFVFFILLRVKNNWIEVSRFIISFALFGMIFICVYLFCKCMIVIE